MPFRSHRVIAAALTLFTAALALSTAAGCRGIQSALDPAGREAGRIANLWWFLFWVCTAVFVIVTAALFLGIFRPRTAASSDPRRGRTVITAAVGATAAILLLFLIVSVSAGRAVAEPAGLSRADSVSVVR